MSKTIDERVVEMRFDNNQFENKAKESIQTLGKLKNALDMDKSAKQFDALGEAVNNISFDGLSAGIQALQDRFSTWGIVSMRIIENVTDSMIRLVTRGVNFVSDAIVSGGLRRAQNIENAHFQLQALLKDEAKVQQYMDDAMDSVDGTAYAYDEAAKAAAQFAASGVEAGDEVSKALKGITGVAAMTNADYESIAMIFTTVAGNGRLMGDQLLQLSSRGMNAAATLADYFQEVKGQSDMTEAAIRDLVSKGKISFQDFAEAMNWAFGDQAKRANETFNGAFANLKAAFARIGAGFFSPLIEQNSDLVLLLNSLRVRVNDIKSALVFDEQASAISGLAEKTGVAKDTMTNFFNTISTRGYVSFEDLSKLSSRGVDAVENIRDYINGVQDGSIRASYATQEAIKAMTDGVEVTSEDIKRFVEEGKVDFSLFTSAMETFHGNLRTITYQFTNWALDWAKKISEAVDNADLTGPLQAFDDLVETAKSGFKTLYSLVKPIAQAFSEAFLSFDRTKYNVTAATGAIKTFVQGLKPSEKTIQNIHDLFKGVFDVIAVVVKGFVNLFKAVLPVSDPINDVASGISDMAGELGRMLSSFAEWISNSETIKTIYEGLSSAIEVVCGWLSDGISLIGDFVDRVKNAQIVQDIVEGIRSAFSKLGDIFTTIKVKFSPFKSVFDFLSSIVRTIGPVVITVFEGIGKALGTIAKGFKDVMGSQESGDLSDILNVGFFTYVLGMLDTWIGRLADGINNVTKIPMMFNNVLTQMKNTLLQLQGAIKADIVQKIAIAIGILAGSMLILSMIDSDRLADSLGVMSVMLLEVFGLMKSLNSIMGAGNPLQALTSYLDSMWQSNSIQAIAIAVLELAAGLYIISKIDDDKMLKAFAVISGLVIEMGILVRVLSGPFVGKLKTGVLPVLAFAAAIVILAGAAKKMSELSWEEIGKGLAAVGGLMTEIGLFMLAANKFGDFGISAGVGIVLLAAAIKILEGPITTFSKMSLKELAKGIGALAVALIAIAGAIRLMPDSGAFGNGVSLVLLAAAIKILEGPITEFSKMSLKEIGKGLLTLAGALGAIVLAFNLMPKSGSFGSAVSILLAAAAVKVLQESIMSFSTLSWQQIAAALVTLGGAIVELAIGAHAMEGAVGGSFAMLIMAAALRVLAPVIEAFGDMSVEQIAKSLITLAGTFIIMGVAGAALQGLVPTILALSGAMALFGAGMFAFGAGLTMIAASATAAAGSILAILNIIILGIIDLIANTAVKIAEAIIAVIVAICDTIGETIPKIVETVLMVVEAVITSLADHAPEIVTQLVRLIVGIIDSLAEHVPELIESIANFASKLFGAIVDVVNDMDSEAMDKLVHGFEIIAVAMIALAALSTIASAAMAGVIEVGIVIGEIGVLLAALGALKQIPGLQWLIDEGGEMLESIGTAIGKFVGGFVGGALEAATAGLPQIGTNLSDFMANVSGFIDGASKIDASLMEGVEALAGVILTLTKAEILDGLTSWLTGGTSLSEFGQQLEDFAPHIANYAEKVKNVDPEVVQASANAALALAEMAEKLPGQDGLIDKLFGEKSLSDFGQELEDFAPHLSKYATSVADVTPEAVEASASAATMMAELAEKLPNSGGLAGKIFGENNLSDFGAELEKFGPSMAAYANSIAGIDTNAVTASASAAQALSTLATGLPNEGGVVGWWSGDNSLGDFGDNLVDFGSDLVDYYNSISGIDTATLSSVTTEIGNLNTLFSTIGSTSSESMLNFVNSLESVANIGLDGFVTAFTDGQEKASEAIEGFLTAIGTAATNAVDSILQIGVDIASKVIEGLTTKIPDFLTAGTDSVNEYIKGISDKKDNAVSAAKTLAREVVSQIKSLYMEFYNAGANAGQGFVDGLSSKNIAAKNAGTALGQAALAAAKKSLNEHSPSKEFEQIGEYGGIGFVKGLIKNADEAYKAGNQLGNSSLDAVRNTLKSVQNYINENLDSNPVITPILDLSEIQSSSSQLAAMLNDSVRNTNVMTSGISIPGRRGSSYDADDLQNEDGSRKSGNVYTFNQYNSSPKALSRTDIYRSTKNQFSQFKEAVSKS